MINSIPIIIQAIRQDYKPECQYITSAEIVTYHPLVIAGMFNVTDSIHIHPDLDHIAISETALCVNQLERVLCAYLLETGYVWEWGKLDFVEWNKSEAGNEAWVIVKEEFEFKNSIKPGVFGGKLKVEEERKSRAGNYHIRCSFEFDSGKHIGSIQLCFIVSKGLLTTNATYAI